MQIRIKKLVGFLISLMVLTIINFILPRLMPGDAFTQVAGEAGEDINIYSEEQVANYKAYYRLDLPLHEQFFEYLANLSKGHLGFSYYYKEDVGTLIIKSLPWTLFLVLSSGILSLIVGALLGIISAFNRDSLIDKGLYFFMIVISEIPAFIIALIGLIIFGAQLGLFPLAGAKTHFVNYASFWDKIRDIARHAFLPILSLSIVGLSGNYLIVRNSLSEVLTKDYMQTARAKGLRPRRIKYRHALRNILLPLVSRLALQFGGLVGGSILAENVFAYPGLGLLMQRAVRVRDYPLIQGIFLVMATMVLISNLLADFIYSRLDPRLAASPER